MAIKKTIELEAKTGKANKDVEALAASIKELVDLTIEQGKETDKALDKVSKNAPKAKSGLKSIATGFKGIGVAIKAAGIGLVVSVIAALTDKLSQNQKVMDTVNTAMNALSIAFNDLFGFVTTNFLPAMEKVKKFFENLTFEKVKKAIQDNLIERFNSALDVLGHLKKAFDNFRQGKFGDAFTDVKNAGKEMVDVMTGVNNVVDRVTDAVVDGAKALVDYSKETIESAKSITELNNAATIAAAQQAKIAKQAELDAERLRQVRDDETLSLEERKKANEDLEAVLIKQGEAMKAQAQLQLAAAQAALKLNNNVENQTALIEAQTNVLDTQAQVTGFLSEQKTNAVALDKEILGLTDSQIEAQNKLNISKKQFAAEGIADDVLRLEKLKEIADEETLIETERLQKLVDNAKAGTQAKIDAENELAAFKEEKRQEDATRDAEIAQAKIDKIGEEAENDLLSFSERRTLLDEQRRTILDDENLTEAERTAALKENTDARVALGEEEAAQKQKALAATSNILGQASKLLGESTAAGKAAAVAQATIDTYQAATSSYNSLSGIPIVGPALGAVAAGLAVASGLANVKKILSVKTPGKGGSGGAAPTGASAPTPPAFNIVGSAPENQLAETINAREQEPVKAFVVSSDVTTSQALDRNIEESATI